MAGVVVQKRERGEREREDEEESERGAAGLSLLDVDEVVM